MSQHSDMEDRRILIHEPGAVGSILQTLGTVSEAVHLALAPQNYSNFAEMSTFRSNTAQMDGLEPTFSNSSHGQDNRLPMGTQDYYHHQIEQSPSSSSGLLPSNSTIPGSEHWVQHQDYYSNNTRMPVFTGNTAQAMDSVESYSVGISGPDQNSGPPVGIQSYDQIGQKSSRGLHQPSSTTSGSAYWTHPTGYSDFAGMSACTNNSTQTMGRVESSVNILSHDENDCPLMGIQTQVGEFPSSSSGLLRRNSITPGSQHWMLPQDYTNFTRMPVFTEISAQTIYDRLKSVAVTSPLADVPSNYELEHFQNTYRSHLSQSSTAISSCDHIHPSVSTSSSEPRPMRGNQTFSTWPTIITEAGPKRLLYCLECGASFAFRSCLERHSRMCIGVAPFTCNFCGKSFNKKRSMNIHLAKVHSILTSRF